MTLPNVLLLIADDLGCGDLGCLGHPYLETPHLDAMAAAGARFTTWRSAAPWCPPARASCLAGRWPSEIGSLFFTPEVDDWRPNVSTTLPVELKKLGYRCAAIGKGHLGASAPADFDHYQEIGWAQSPATTSRRIAKAARAWIRTAPEPWFAWVAFRAPHIPIRPSAAQLKAYATLQATSKTGAEKYWAVVTDLDRHAGRLLRDNPDALTFLTSDHGPQHPVDFAAGRTAGLRGFKGSLYEGGLRVPMIVRFPGTIPAGTVIDAPASSVDLMPTILGFAGGAVSGLDGVDLSALLTGGSAPKKRTFFASTHRHVWKMPYLWRPIDRSPPFAVWRGARKLLAGPSNGYELYDLAQDPGERHNLWPHHKAGKKLARRLKSWIDSWWDPSIPAPMPEEGEI